MDLVKSNKNISDICDMVEEYQALIQISPGYIFDLTEIEKMDLEKPDWYEGELVQYNRAIKEWIDVDQVMMMEEDVK